MVTNELGVWKAEDCALVLIDYQNEMFEVIRSETTADISDSIAPNMATVMAGEIRGRSRYR